MTAIRIKIFLLIITNVRLGVNTKALLKLVLLVILIFGFSEKSFSQCEVKFDYKTELAETGGKIIIKYLDGEGPFTFKLFDWEDGINDYIDESQKASFKANEEFLVFDNLPASTYTVQVITPNGCQSSIGGIEKITIRSKNNSNEIR